MIEYRLAPLAKSDLDEIWSYLERKGGADLADRVILAFDEKFETLALMPGAGRARSDMGANLRSMPVGKYLIYYETPPKGRIVIARVLHGSRDQRSAFELI